MNCPRTNPSFPILLVVPELFVGFFRKQPPAPGTVSIFGVCAAWGRQVGQRTFPLLPELIFL